MPAQSVQEFNNHSNGVTNKRRTSESSESLASAANSQEECYCTYIGLEPVLFVQNIVSQLVYVTSQDLMVEKTCTVSKH